MGLYSPQALERQRLKRMRGAGGDDDSGADAEDAVAPMGGYALRRHKAALAVRWAPPLPLLLSRSLAAVLVPQPALGTLRSLYLASPRI